MVAPTCMINDIMFYKKSIKSILGKIQETQVTIIMKMKLHHLSNDLPRI